ncbi:MAG: GerMN domain-containing protein [Leptospiraceae bacterium]|nr:GerMN domain-containing protein [Leptospiraceae bacterium]
MNRGAGGQGPASPTEAENRAILILGGILLLLIFLDRQASEQINLRAATPDVTQPAALIQEKLESGVDRTKNQLQGVRETLQGEAEDGIRSGLEKGKENLEERLVPVKRPIDDILQSRMQDPGAPSVDGRIQPQQLQSENRLALGEGQKGGYYLYFLRFNGSRSNIVRVSRSVQKGITYKDLLVELQKGPREQETGLLSAVDRSIEILSVHEEDGVVTVDLGSGINRMGSSIIRDRVHQICFTLFQFSNVKAVQILVNGEKPAFLGTGSDRLKLPDFLGYPDRKIQVYGSS